MFLSFSFYPSLPLHFAHFFFFSLVSKPESERTSHTYVQFRTVHFISKVNSVEIKSSGYGIESPGNRVGWIDTSSIGAYYIFTRTRR